jgi:thioesterase domain-containing protein
VAIDGSIVSTDGVSLAYRDYAGNGPGVVLLHGIGGNIESMDGLARLLGGDRRVVSLDIRFCGQSGDAGRFRFQDAVRDVEEVSAALALSGPAVVGRRWAARWPRNDAHLRNMSVERCKRRSKPPRAVIMTTASAASHGSHAEPPGSSSWTSWVARNIVAPQQPSKHRTLNGNLGDRAYGTRGPRRTCANLVVADFDRV